MQEILKKINRRVYPEKLFYSPAWVILVVNNVCNLHCKMCDVGVGFESSNFYMNMLGAHPINMPFELVKKIVDQTSASFRETKIAFSFTEPIIYPHLVDSVAYATEHGLHSQMTTNGSKLPALADDLVGAGIKEICISLDGPPEIHNFIRGNKHSFEWAFEGLEKIASLNGKTPELSVACAITEWNFHSLASFAELFRKVPLKEMFLMHTNYTTDAIAIKHNAIYGTNYPATSSNTKELHLEKMNLEVLLKEIQKIHSLDLPFAVKFSPELKTAQSLETFYNHPEIFIGKRCVNAFDSITVKSDGTVMPAHTRCYQVQAGNIYNNSLEEIWNSASITQFRKTLNDAGGFLPACSRCCSAF